jgi:hypothetical protein
MLKAMDIKKSFDGLGVLDGISSRWRRARCWR